MKLSTVCISVLVAIIAIGTIENSQYLAMGYYLHVLPLAYIVCLASRMFGEDSPKVSTAIWSLVIVTAVCIFLEVHFEMFKRKPFDENGPINLLSVCQLLMIAFASLAVWQTRKEAGFSLKNVSNIWLIMGVGFIFLALDEKALIHEGLDREIHKFLGLQSTKWTSHLDDFIIAAYGVIGLCVLKFYFAEIRRFRQFLLFLKVGFPVLFLAVIADVSSSKPEMYTGVLGFETEAAARSLAEGVEESLELLSQIFFLAGFMAALKEAREMKAANSVSANNH